MTLVGSVVVILFAALVMVGGGTALVMESFGAEQRTPALGILTAYKYLAVPLSGICIILFVLGQTLERLYDRSPTEAEGDAALEDQPHASEEGGHG